MKRILPLLCLLASVLVSCKPAGPSASSDWKSRIPATVPAGGSLVVVATLEPIPAPFPANDLYKYAYIMKYSVDTVIRGTFAGKEILVGQYDPRTPRYSIEDDQKGKVGGNVDGFHPGDRHYLVLRPLDSAWTGAIEDDEVQDKSPRWWAVRTDRI
jgi:hypothetical protein